MKIVSEISGGADSMLSTLVAREKYPDAEIHCFMVNYGQVPFKIELKKVISFCKENKFIFTVVSLNGLFSGGTVIGEQEVGTEGIAKVYTPLRNLVILSMAASYAESIGADRIITGSKTLSVDSNPYSFKDSTLPFYKMFESMLSYTAYSPIKIEMILGEGRQNKMTKQEVYQELFSRGYNWDSFWNCFNAGPEECGKCNNCIEKDKIKDILSKDFY
jgi:7-cyano-7-deazaguanine synthase